MLVRRESSIVYEFAATMATHTSLPVATPPGTGLGQAMQVSLIPLIILPFG